MDRRRPAYDHAPHRLVDRGPLGQAQPRQQCLGVLDARDRRGAALAQAQHRDAAGQRAAGGVLVVVADDDPGRDDRTRRRQPLGWLEQAAVELQRGLGEVRVEVVGEHERQAELRGDPGAAVGRSEHPQLGHRVLAGDRAHAAVAAPQMAAQLLELLLEELGRGAAQRQRRADVRARRAAEAEIDPVGMQRLEHPEALGDRQRRVVGQHHAARADADALGARRDVRDQRLGRRRRDGRDVVVLGHPEAAEAELVGAAREVGGSRQRVGGALAGADRREIEDRKRSAHSVQGRGRDRPARRAPRKLRSSSLPSSVSTDSG